MTPATLERSRSADVDQPRAALPSSAAATLLLAGMVAVEFSGASGVLEGRVPVSPFLALLALGLLVVVGRCLVQRVAVPWATVGAVSAYVLATALSSQLADLDGVAFLRTGVEPDWGSAAVLGVLKELVFVVVVCLLASGLRRWWLVAAAMVLPMAAICLLGALNEWVLGNTATFGGFETVTTAEGVGVVTKRHAGPLPDANFWGRFLVLGLPFALALVQECLQRGRRLLALVPLGCLGALLVGVYLTGSRGTMLAALVGAGLYLLLCGLDRRVLAAGAVVVVPLLLVLPGVGSRLLSMLGVAESGQLAAVDGSVRERIATQTVATKMIQDNPLTGVGPGGYFARFPDYASATDLHLERIVAPHNLYLGLWAEIGLVGLLAFLSILAVALWQAGWVLRALPSLPSADAARLRPYAAACVAGLLAWCAASVFLHLTYARIVYLVVALAAALATQARALGAHRVPRPPRHRTPAYAVPLAAAGAALAALVVTSLPQPAHARVVGYLEPQSSSAYLLSLRTREVTAPTYAVLTSVASGRTVDAQGDPASGLVSVSAEAETPEQADRLARDATAAGDAAVRRAGLDTLFRTRWGTVTTWRETPGRSEVAAAMTIGAVLGAALAHARTILAAVRPRRRPDHPDHPQRPRHPHRPTEQP